MFRTFAILAVGEIGARVDAGAGSRAGATAVRLPRQRPDWETMVNRLLDWADEARRLGRRRRADDLVGLAWEAYERMHP